MRDDHRREAEENWAPETAYLFSPVQMLTSHRRPSHLRKIIIGKMQVEAFREMQIHFITSPPLGWLHSESQIIARIVGENAEKSEPSNAAGGNVK